jgi:Methyltransferase FkbM domain
MSLWGTLSSAAQELGHTWVDVLKVDIEGSEFEVMHHLAALNHGMPFTQLQVEVHFGWNSVNPNRQALALLYNLMSRGLRAFYKV